MIRLAALLTAIALLAAGLAWLADEPGRVAIDWGVYHIELSVLTLVAAIALLALVAMGAFWLAFALWRGPRAWRRGRELRKQEQGLLALAETFAAIAAQDGKAARKHMKRAEHMLPGQPLTLMLASQVARLEGNDSKAQLYLEQMSKSSVTSFLAMRGLIEQARRAGDDEAALRHAEQAYAIKPNDHWLVLTLTGLHVRRQQTAEAVRVIERAWRKRVISREELRQLWAGVLCESAAANIRERQWDMAVHKLREAMRRSPGFVPAVIRLSGVYLAQGDISLAIKYAGDSWKRNPHREVTTLLLGCYDAAKDKKKAARIIRKLARLRAQDRESFILLGQLALRQGEPQAARGLFNHALEQFGETALLAALIAEAEEKAGSDEDAAAWLKRAKDAPAEPGWECSSCKRTSPVWYMDCPGCGAVGSFS